jgi:hypothetical protein
MKCQLHRTALLPADDTAVMAVGETAENSTRKLQSAVDKVTNLDRKIPNKTQWFQIGIYTDFRNKKIRQQPNFINGT